MPCLFIKVSNQQSVDGHVLDCTRGIRETSQGWWAVVALSAEGPDEGACLCSYSFYSALCWRL